MIDPISDQQQQQQSEEKEASAIQNSEVKEAERLEPTAPPERKPSPTLASPSIEHKRLSKFDSTTLRAQMVHDDISTDLPMRPEGPLPTFDQPRGGVIVETKVGNVQFGMPAETIKDCLGSGLMVPQYFVVPTVSFVRQLGPNIGLNVAEFEFPAYCNFFFYKRRVTLIVATEEVKERIKKVFQETLFGPDRVDVSQDFKEGTLKDQMPEMQKELDFFRIFMGKKMELEDLLDFIVFSDEGVARIEQEDKETKEKKEVLLQWRSSRQTGAEDDGEYVVIQDDYNCGIVSDKVTLPPPPAAPEVNDHVFEPPLFGVTVLGSSHGFDPSGKTSGYVLWLSKRGYMVDPPPHSSAILAQNNIPQSLITGVIITHCHADHDAGTFQKILQEGRITLMTTQTIHDSFIRKYAALSGLDPQLLRKSFHFRPVKIGENIKMRGGIFRFFYSLHAIPCVGFEVFLGDKSMVFSADHMNDPPKIKELHSDGVINEWRKDQLLNFPWHRDIILHEAGIPPIHTPMETLANLPEDVKQRLYVVHVSGNAFKPEFGLKPAPVGVENTLTLEVEEPENAAALEVLDLVTNIDLFSSLTIQHAREILQIVEVAEYKAGDYVIRKGDEGHTMMIIASGKADVRITVLNREDRLNERKSMRKGLTPRSEESTPRGMEGEETAASMFGRDVEGAENEEDEGYVDEEISRRKSMNGRAMNLEDLKDKTQTTVKTFTTGDYFGEQALVAPDCIRSADIIARTDLICYEFRRQDFNWLLHGTSVVAKIERMIMARQDSVWELLSMNSVLRMLTPTQKTQLEQRCEPKFFEAGAEVWAEGESAHFKFEKKAPTGGGRRRAASVFRHLGPPPPPMFYAGTFVGEIDALLEDKPLQTSLVTKEEGQAMIISKKDMLDFFTNAPGVLLAMLHTQFIMPTAEATKTTEAALKLQKEENLAQITKRNSILEGSEEEEEEED
ncbi:hypothetical protein TL16_g01128 [Triparma laevis f. inornata]|uniref:Cyclic nucleotide-binding domain-containing protein n=1 Tax=Triparma laevis f. inornata TaxID=1714386 RepID=A0A9W6ZK33_9STRA|nr:hypothetical protein TL16_g01128 [Triparma laevis f. inornata]